ncbi:cupin [Rhodococcus sp. WMMA185]|uniref:cupin domain-containing protein n=1 Tax=Rhodococcus sp. WMMA185 TaxID=679318 RepID=UPI0008783FDD|nr:cupin domain-containing protein [Rhodococcus sp. WMMA185]AOW93351.1 cupin [Rhodococcus sp. WMMA185]
MAELPDWARPLDLTPHPEGGWYRETWRSDITVPEANLPDYPGPRSAGTAILFLLMPGQRSVWHTVRSAEIWLYHRGSPLVLELGGDGPKPASPTAQILGSDVAAGEQPQLLVPPRHWQSARSEGDEPTLVSCVVVPGFDFEDFRLI